MIKHRTKNRIGWLMILIGLAGVYFPHFGFLANIIPDLNIVSHSVFEIISATIILGGILFKE